MNDEFNVYPNITRTMKICKAKYQVLEIVLFQFVRIAVYLYNEHNLLIEAKQYVIEGDEYTNWTNDDKYIVNLLKQKIQNDG